jgi:hypothetical protein
LGCLADCSYDLSGCDTSTCGNGEIDGDELCDGSELDGRSCTDLDGDGNHFEPGDYAGGTLACASDCTLDVSGCYYCGDGVINGTELCDGSDTGSATCESLGYVSGTLTCNATCDGYDESGCNECDDCTDCDGQACTDHVCGTCVTDSDCCAPLYCYRGHCEFPY